MITNRLNNSTLEDQKMRSNYSSLTNVTERKSCYYTASEFRQIAKADLNRLFKKHDRI